MKIGLNVFTAQDGTSHVLVLEWKDNVVVMI